MSVPTFANAAHRAEFVEEFTQCAHKSIQLLVDFFDFAEPAEILDFIDGIEADTVVLAGFLHGVANLIEGKD